MCHIPWDNWRKAETATLQSVTVRSIKAKALKLLEVARTETRKSDSSLLSKQGKDEVIWKCLEVPDAILLHYSIKFRKQCKTGPTSLSIAQMVKICTNYNAPGVVLSGTATSLPEMKQEVISSQNPTLYPVTQKISLHQQETWTAVCPLHSEFLKRWTARVRKNQVARDPAEPCKVNRYKVWGVGQKQWTSTSIWSLVKTWIDMS